MLTLAETFLEQLTTRGEFLQFVIFSGGIGIALVAIIGGMIKHMVVSRAREQTKRELAAYVAEGSIDPDKAVEIINAGRKKWEVGGCDATV